MPGVIDREWERDIATLRAEREKQASNADRELFDKVLASLESMKLSITQNANKYELSVLSKITQAVAQSRSAREAVHNIDEILSGNLLEVGAEVRALNETTRVILEKERQIRAYQKQLENIQIKKKKDTSQRMVVAIVAIIIGLIAWMLSMLGGD